MSNEESYDIADFDMESFVENADWQVAKTYQDNPHSYTVRDWHDNTTFERAIRYIRRFGQPELFYSNMYIYWYHGGYKYWTMGDPVNETQVINRADADKPNEGFDNE